MRDVFRLMSKVFAIVFGAGFALVVLGYLVLGGVYVFDRTEAPKDSPSPARGSIMMGNSPIGTVTMITPLYDEKSLPNFLPDAQLNCEVPDPWPEYNGKEPLCLVEINNKVAGVITHQEAKANLKGWQIVPPETKTEK